MEDDGEAGELLLDLVENVEGQGRRNETTGLRVARALLGLELVSAVARTDGDGERVATGTGREVDDLLGTRVVALLGADLVLDAGEHTEFSLYGHIKLVGVFHALLRQFDVFLVWQR